MKILITGNMGYVGPVMVRHFQKYFVEPALIGLDTGFFAHCLTGTKLMPEILLDQQWFKDAREVGPKDLEGFDAVVHLAAISNDPMGKAFEAVTADINQHASVRLAAAAKQAGVRSFVFASSCSVYGYAEGAARDENSELHPLTEYARSKIGTEAEIEVLADDSFVVTCLRFPTACGMSDRLRLDLVLNDFVASAVATGKIQILSDGSPWRPLIDVKDMSRAAEWAVKRDPAIGGPFLSVNAGRTEWNYQIRDLAEAVSKEMNGVEIDINKNAAPDKRSYRVDFSLYESLAPNHLPQIELAQSIRELKSGLESMEFDDADFRMSNLIRLKMLEQHRKSGRLDESLRATV